MEWMRVQPSVGTFKDKVCVVVGGGQGLGRRYCLDLAAAGARVVVVGHSDTARDVADEIGDAGGTAVAIVREAQEGEAIVADALTAFGTVDAILVNAGVTRDRSFAKMSRAEWDEVLDVHLNGAFACARAIWDHFVTRGGGAILFTTSGAGFHGAFGQANYAAAKAGILGLTRTLAIEGTRRNIRVNAIAPMAHTGMTDEVFPDALKRALTVEGVSPFALALLHPDCGASGQFIEAGGGWAAAVRWERSKGLRLSESSDGVAAILSRWNELIDFEDGSDLPNSTADSLGAASGADRTMRASTSERRRPDDEVDRVRQLDRQPNPA